MTISLDQLGIFTETATPLRKYPSIVLYSGSGCGKSTELAVAFQDALFIKTAVTVTRPYYSWLRELDRATYDRVRHDWTVANAAHSAHIEFENSADMEGLKAVSAITGYKYKLEEQTLPSNVNNWATLTAIKDQLCAAIDMGHTLPICGIVIDEATEVLRRVFIEMQQSGSFKGRKGGTDLWAVQDGLEAWWLQMTEAFRDHGLLLASVCQEAPPSFEEGTTIIKYRGGPATPFGRLRATMCSAADLSLRITLEAGGVAGPPSIGLPPPTGAAATPPAAPSTASGPPRAPTASGAPPSAPQAPDAVIVIPGLPAIPVAAKAPTGPSRWAKRRYWTEAHPEWQIKFRDFAISHREELGLRRLLRIAGYI